jgi:hypothetical protein
MGISTPMVALTSRICASYAGPLPKRLLIFGICASIALTLTAGCASVPAVPGDTPSQGIVPATLALELGEWDEAVATLSVQRDQYPNSADIAYSLGYAYWGKLRSLRGDGDKIQPMGMLGREEEFLLSEALIQFMAVSKLHSSGEVTAKSLYFAGQCLDIGNLQRFEEALELYGLCSDRYPGTEAGWRCLERYGQLIEKFEGISGGSHGMGQ